MAVRLCESSSFARPQAAGCVAGQRRPVLVRSIAFEGRIAASLAHFSVAHYVRNNNAHSWPNPRQSLHCGTLVSPAIAHACRGWLSRQCKFSMKAKSGTTADWNVSGQRSQLKATSGGSSCASASTPVSISATLLICTLLVKCGS